MFIAMIFDFNDRLIMATRHDDQLELQRRRDAMASMLEYSGVSTWSVVFDLEDPPLAMWGEETKKSILAAM